MKKSWYCPRMHTRKYYNNTLIPKYLSMMGKLDNDVLGIDALKNETINICNCLNNILEYFANENPDYLREKVGVETVDEFKKKVFTIGHVVVGCRLNIDYYGYVRDIADCGKHKELGRASAKIKSSGDIRETLALIRYADDDGYYYSYKKIVVATDDDGRAWPCEVLIYCAFVFITNTLIDAGVIPAFPTLQRIKREFYISRSDAEKRNVPEMRGIEGEHIDVYSRCYIYEVQGLLQIRDVKKEDEFDTKFPATLNVTKGMYN